MVDQHVVPGGPPYSQPDVQWRPEFSVWWVKASKLFTWADCLSCSEGSTKWLSSNCCQILRFVGPTQRMKKHHWVHGLDETRCNMWNSVLIGDLLPSSMFTFLDAGIFTFLLADVFPCSKDRKCTIQVVLWFSEIGGKGYLYLHSWTNSSDCLLMNTPTCP